MIKSYSEPCNIKALRAYKTKKGPSHYAEHRPGRQPADVFAWRGRPEEVRTRKIGTKFLKILCNTPKSKKLGGTEWQMKK